MSIRSQLARVAVLVLAPGLASFASAGVLTVCAAASPEGFDIAQYEANTTIDIAGRTLYDQLVHLEEGSVNIVAGLAEHWEISPDGLIYTFHLRRGVRFHATPWFKPSRDLDADDVIFSFTRIIDPDHPFHKSAQAGYPYWNGLGMHKMVRSVEKIDGHTVRINLARASASLLANLSVSSVGSIFSAEYARMLQEQGKPGQFNTLPIGTGPFVFKSYQKDAVVRFEPNRNYWAGVPRIAALIYAIVPDSDMRIQKVRAGECLVGLTIKRASAAVFDKVRNVDLVSTDTLTTTYLALNTTRRFLDDRRLREAISLAIDRDNLVKLNSGRHVNVAGSLLPPGMWSHDPELRVSPDTRRAIALARQSGYGGQTLTLGSLPSQQQTAQALQGDLARIGVKVTLAPMEFGEFLRRADHGEFDLVLMSWGADNGDPDNFLTPNASCGAIDNGGNYGRWCDHQLDALLDAARQITDRSRRTELYRKIQRLLHDGHSVVPLLYASSLTAINKRVHGFSTNPLDGNDFRGAWVD